MVTRFVADPVAFPAIWTAATAAPFTGRYVYRIQNIPDQLKALGVELELPSWWATNLADLTFPRDDT